MNEKDIDGVGYLLESLYRVITGHVDIPVASIADGKYDRKMSIEHKDRFSDRQSSKLDTDHPLYPVLEDKNEYTANIPTTPVQDQSIHARTDENVSMMRFVYTLEKQVGSRVSTNTFSTSASR